MQHNILIGADICPTKSNLESFASGDIKSLIDEKLQKLLLEADFTIFNLEVPLVDSANPIIKNGPNLIAPTNTINGIKTMNPHFFTLANNHIMDQGIVGLHSTMRTLNEAGISYAGVGDTPEEAAKPFIFELGSKKIGIYCCAEHEFSIVTKHSPGANPFDPLESPDHIAKLKEQCDYVIVLYHGGKEHYRYPSPNLQKTFRKLAEKGADLVIAQHTHCVGCQEIWKGTTLVYGQGNFLFDMADNEYWNSSLLINVQFDDEAETPTISYIPLVKANHRANVAVGREAESIIDGFEKRSGEILNSEIVEKKYTEFAEASLQNYLGTLYGAKNKKFLIKALNKLSKSKYRKFILKRNYGLAESIAIQNMLECEAHRELAISCLKNSQHKPK